jgi:hypothetical protein
LVRYCLSHDATIDSHTAKSWIMMSICNVSVYGACNEGINNESLYLRMQFMNSMFQQPRHILIELNGNLTKFDAMAWSEGSSIWTYYFKAPLITTHSWTHSNNRNIGQKDRFTVHC